MSSCVPTSTRSKRSREANEALVPSDMACPSPVVYLVDEDLSLCDFSSFVPQHAMKPWRLTPCHELVLTLPGVKERLTIVRPPKLSLVELTSFHSPQYIRQLCLHNQQSWCWHPSDTASKVAFNGDCPPVEGILEFIAGVAAASLQGAILLNKKKASVCINWAGGLHHGKVGECQGYCYVNDIVIAILELLKVHRRVLYIDLDVHHGDGVEEAFLVSDRVFTLSLHKYGDGFFPGTGHLQDVGLGQGRHYAMNLPLPDGIEDDDYFSIFSDALSTVVQRFQPEAVVLQCGADSLAADRVGTFNLSSLGHGRCVSAVQRLGLPLLVLGGGGYSVKNVARLWAYETAILCGLVSEVNFSSVHTSMGVSRHTPVPKNLPSGWLFDLATSELAENEEDAEAASNRGSKKETQSKPQPVLPQVTLHVPSEFASLASGRGRDYVAALDNIRAHILAASRKIQPLDA